MMKKSRPSVLQVRSKLIYYKGALGNVAKTCKSQTPFIKSVDNVRGNLGPQAIRRVKVC